MPIPAVSSPGTPTAQPIGPAQAARQSSEAAQARISAANAPAAKDSDNDNDTDVRATQRVQEAKPSLNTQGQTVGTTIDTTA